MDVMKKCKTCGEIKPISEFHKHSGCKYGVRNECKLCRIERQGKYQKENREEYLEYQRNHYKNNKDLYRKLRELNPNTPIHKKKEYEKHKKDYFFRATLRKERIKIATPIWADIDKIKKIYNNCPKGYHVDHIIPIKGINVSGLHVHTNLQYLTAKENLMKGNKTWN